MAGYVPRPLPDELLYSLLARTAAHRGASSAAAFATEVFGRRHVISSFDLSGYLDALAAWLGGHDGLGVDMVIDRLTLFPFYAAYASAGRRRAARQAMAGSMAGVHTGFGVATFRIPPLRALRFCPECLREWEREGSEWRWRRSHQLGGVAVCPDHGVPLRRSGVSLDAGDRHAFVAASPVSCPTGAPPVVPGAEVRILDRLALLARAARMLLDVPMPALEPGELVERCRRRLGDVGLMRSARKVDQAALQDGFLAFWRGVPALMPRVFAEGLPVGGWLVGMTRARDRTVHPVCHLMLSLYLDSLETTARPFGAGPWPCRNPLADHHGAAVVTSVVVRRDGTMRYGDFRCGCGYLYTRSLALDGTAGQPRYRAFGPLLGPALVRLVRQGSTLRGAAAAVGLDPRTLIREAGLRGMSLPWRTRASGSILPRVAPRRHFYSASGGDRSRHPSAARRGPTTRRRSRDWPVVDREFAASVSAHADEIRRAAPPVRVTAAELERRLATVGWISRRREKLPLTWSAIRRQIEPVDVYRTRRLEHVVRQPAAATGTPSGLLRRAGLPMDWLPAVRTAMIDRPSRMLDVRPGIDPPRSRKRAKR